MRLRWLGCAILAALAAACAQVDPVHFHKVNAALLDQAIAQSDAVAAHPKLFYLGFALFSEPWSENDVIDWGARLGSAKGYNQASIILSNNIFSTPTGRPAATPEAMLAAVAHVAKRYQPGDLVVVAVSSHGAKDVLVSKLGRQEPTGIPARVLHDLFSLLKDAKAVIIVSACHSGSLIPALAADNRIIITAARADRISFGCAPTATHTVFGEALAAGFDGRNRSLRAVLHATGAWVARMENQMKLEPSEPQVFVGKGVAEFMDQELF